MTDLPSDEQRRAAVLAATAEAYERYTATGHAERWRNPPPGMQRAIRERDAWLVDVLAPAFDGTIVDLGAGDGALAGLLQAVDAMPRRLLGIDIQAGRLEDARLRVPAAEFVVASADRVPLPDGAASAVVAMTLLSSLTDRWFRERVAAEVARVLEPGGRFVVYDIRYPSPSNRSVIPITAGELRRLFPTWRQSGRSITLLPPLARSRLVGDGRRYSALHALPLLRSHRATTLVKPER